MFQSVINQPVVSAGRFGTGVWVSLMVHAGVFAAVLGLSGTAIERLPPKEYEIGPMRRTVQPVRPDSTPHPAPVSAPPSRPRADRKPQRELVQPVTIPPPPRDEPPATEPVPSPVAAVGDSAAASSVSPELGPNEALGSPPNPNNPNEWLVNTAAPEEVLPFGASMTPPELLSGAQLQYTREAVAARVSGTVIARCTITREGDVENCRIIRGLPHMDEAVLEALTSRHYRPVTFQGRPVSVSYAFQVKLKLP
ncbi:TonB family protein [Archangium gephyra]|uniref:energy transducer TonB n=1 Tax=Archangium gephyra TaxID=48 RepID=UPI0035D48BCC